MDNDVDDAFAAFRAEHKYFAHPLDQLLLLWPLGFYPGRLCDSRFFLFSTFSLMRLRCNPTTCTIMDVKQDIRLKLTDHAC